MTLEERLEGIVAGTQKKEAVEAILSWFKEQLPKEAEHSESCLYVIEPRYFGNLAKEKRCDCGAVDRNQCLQDIKNNLEK